MPAYGAGPALVSQFFSSAGSCRGTSRIGAGPAQHSIRAQDSARLDALADRHLRVTRADYLPVTLLPAKAYGPWYISLPCVAQAVATL
jgi:hypothetical protein